MVGFHTVEEMPTKTGEYFRDTNGQLYKSTECRVFSFDGSEQVFYYWEPLNEFETAVLAEVLAYRGI